MQYAPYFFLVEGPDGSGKSTLCKALSTQLERLNYSVLNMHAGYRFKRQGIFTFHTAMLDVAIRSGSDVVILDRHWISEVVYGHACRGGSDWPSIGRFMDRILTRCGVTYVRCQPPIDVCADTVASRRDDELYPDSARAVYNAYGSFYDAKLGYIPKEWVLYDRNAMSAESAAMLLSDLVQQSRQPAFDGKITGNVNADICLMGEALNPKTHRARWPFHDYGNSSLALAETLDLARHHESHTFVCNSTDAGLAVDTLLAKIGKSSVAPRIVALGGRAFDTAIEAAGWSGIEITMVEHPQYIRRFSRRPLSEYAGRLGSALYDRASTGD